MEKVWTVLAGLVLASALCLPARALTGQVVLERQVALIDVEGLQRAAA